MAAGGTVLDIQARRRQDELAIIDGAVRRTWDEWDARACKLAALLRDEHGVGPGVRVAWMMPNGAAYFDLWFALSKLGAAAVPVPWRLTGGEAAYIIDHADARVVLVAAELLPRLAEVRAALPRVEAILVAGAGAAELPGVRSLEAALAEAPDARFVFNGKGGATSVIYTSGTTGRPKGAVREAGGRNQEALRVYGHVVAAAFGFSPAAPEVHLVACPLYHSAPPAFAHLAHATGGRVVVMARFDAEEALALIDREKVTSTCVVPTVLRRLCTLPPAVREKYDLSSMRRLAVGGAPCPVELKEKAAAVFGEHCLYEFYGASETAVCTVIGPGEHFRRPGSCGRPLPGVELRLLDDEGNAVPRGEPGEVWARNPMVVSGYHKDPEATRRASRDGFFTVGDVGRLDEDGYLYIVDRKSDLIISGGVNVYPAEIEVELRRHPAVYDCAVIGVPDEEWGEAVKAVVQPVPGAALDAAALLAFVAERLAGYKRPRSIELVDELPLGATGKIDKRALRARYWSDAGRRI
jgi:acyl-CoA synthetase (AMP-forming)/AMP-acid ligase II